MMRKSVLIVEDDAVVTVHLCNMLTGLGYSVPGTIATGEMAITAAVNAPPDLILMDIHLAGQIDGITAARRIRHAVDVPVIFLTSYSQEPLIERAKTTVPYGYLIKPVSQKELAVTIEMALSRHKMALSRHTLEKKMSEQSEKLKLLMTTVEQSSVSIVITDRHGLIQYVNPHFCDMTGYTVEEAIGQNPRILKSDDTPPEFYQDMWQTILAGRIWKGEIKNRKKNGELFWERATISPVYNLQSGIKNRTTNGKVGDERSPALPVVSTPEALTNFTITNFIAVKEDITYEKKLEEEHRKLEQLRQQEQVRAMNQRKLASLGEIATGIAHEINQPLTFINTLLHTTIERFEKNAFDVVRLTAKFETAIHQAGRITTIIDHLRTFGRADENKVSPVSLEAILDNVLILMQERIRIRNIVVVRKIDKNLPSILGNSHALEQIFINFFQNSIDAMQAQGGGKIMISMGHEQGSNEMWLSFADNGPGMTPAVQEKIFEPFFTTKDIGKGTGLGLAVVFGIVKDHHGEIVCPSEPGKGATFYMTLPLQPPIGPMKIELR